jgi:hypothetical protein
MGVFALTMTNFVQEAASPRALPTEMSRASPLTLPFPVEGEGF